MAQTTSDPARHPGPEPADPAELAARFGLERVGTRPPLPAYLRALVQRRHFIWEMARARVHSSSARQRLGRLWEPLNPLLLAAVYYLAFGVLLGSRKDSANFELFLVVGIFVWTFLAGGIIAGSKSIVSNTGLIRSIQFPRAVLPLAATAKDVILFRSKLLVIAAVALLTGQAITPSWLLIFPAMLLTSVFTLGMGLIAARLVVHVRDLSNILPLILRTVMYLSGVFYSIEKRVAGAPAWARFLIEINPGNVYISLARGAFMPTHHPTPPSMWIAGSAWAVGALVVGFLMFWQAEEHYGRG